MKWSFVLLFTSCMQLSAAVYSQQEKTDISVRDVSIEELIRTIKSSIQVDFLYNLKEIEQNGTVSVEMKNATVEDILREAFKNKALTYSFVNGVFVIRPAKIVVKDSIRKMYDIKGQVFDKKKQPLPGVTVRLEGTTIGTAADNDGKFVIRIPQDTGQLIITFVGFKQKKVGFRAGKPLIVTLEEDMADLDEVVVRAYGTQNKREVVGAISSVKADEMKELPTASLVNMLQGRLAGVNIVNQSGAPGSAQVVAIRGFNSLLTKGASDGQPLYVVDGVPMHSFVSPVSGTNTMADIDPTTIESVEVLKDAAAASIYGSRAGNGVILITTKKGKAGEAKFSANVSYSASQLMSYPVQTGGRMERWFEILTTRNQRTLGYNSTDRLRFYPTSYEEVYKLRAGTYDGFWGTGRNAVKVEDRLQDSLNSFYNNETNWWKYIYRTGKVINANLQASGGSERFQYMVGAGYYSEGGIAINSSYARMNVISNLSARPSKNLKMDVRLTLSYMDKSRNTENALVKNRFEGVTANPGNTSTLLPNNEELADRWLHKMNSINDKADSYRAMGNLFLEYTLFKGLTFSVSGSIDFSQGNSNTFKPSDLDPNNKQNMSSGAIGRQIMIMSEELLRYKTSIREKHNLELLLGLSINKEQYHGIGGWGKAGPSDNIYYYDPDINVDVYDYGMGGTTPKWKSTRLYRSDFREKVMVSYFARFGYNYKQRYLIEGTIRRDGSSTFGEDHKWADFPSVAVGWAFSQENFMKWAHWLDWGKFRASYGTSGQIFTFEYLAHGLMRISTSTFLNEKGTEADKAISPDLTWEKTEQYNLGLDLDMFDYRVKVKMDYYYKLTSSLIYDVPLPGNMLISNNRTENAMELSNEGIELELETDIFRQGALKWRTKFNVARNWNRFKKTYNEKDAGGYIIGRPMSGMYVYASEGYYDTEEDVPVMYDVLGNQNYLGGVAVQYGTSGMVGTQKLKDLDGNGYINDSDRYYVGTAQPLAHGGWVNELRWKNFDLNMLFNYCLGRSMINLRPQSVYSIVKNVDLNDYTFWEKPGDNSDLPILGKTFQSNIDSNVEKVHSVSLKQITLGYDMPKTWSKKAGFSGVRLFLTAENLFYLSNYSGDNPEVVDVYTGIDNGLAYPLPRKYSVGLTLNF